MSFERETTFSAGVIQHEQLGSVIRLQRNPDAEHPGFVAEIDPAHGSNLIRFSVGAQELIHTDADALQRGEMTGVPIMYPTPGRLRTVTNKSRVFEFEGNEYELIAQDRYDVPHLVHGIAHDQPWQVEAHGQGNDSAHAQTIFVITPNHQLHQQSRYPFASRLVLNYVLHEAGISVHYNIQNLSQDNMPVNFGFHPFFTRLSGDDTQISVPANYVLETDEELLPTGRLLPHEEALGTDLSQPTPIGQLDLDHVFTDITGVPYIVHPEQGIVIKTETTDDMKHVVAWTPPNEPFLALENQIGSPNAHNLPNKEQANLQIITPGNSHQGSVTYRVVFQQ